MQVSLPNTAIVLFPSGAFGGAEKRFTNLFLYLSEMYPGKLHLIINPLMQKHLARVFPDKKFENLHIIDTGSDTLAGDISGILPAVFKDSVEDPVEIDKRTSYLRKVYWYNKNKRKQHGLFRKIESIRVKENIQVFIGVFAGGLPLVFYKEKNIAGVKIIFSDMDSWFSEILRDPEKLWYRKYYAFNNILQNADMVDFLSPYIAEGVKLRGVKIPEERISIAPASFIDHSKCMPGSKENFEFAFAARLEPDKNPLMYLEAAKEVLKEYPAVKFHLLGEGSLVEEIRSFIKNNSMEENVNFAFHKNPPEIFANTSVFVSLQSGTNYPSQSVLEAMSCENAVIASNTGDTGLFINQQNGVLVDLNAASVSNAMKMLLKDKVKTTQLGKSAGELAVKNHTIEKVSAYYTDMIINVHGGGYIG